MSKWIIHSAIMAGCFFLAHSTAMAQVQSFFGAGQKQAVTQPSAQKPSVSPPLSPQEYKASVNQRYQTVSGEYSTASNPATCQGRSITAASTTLQAFSLKQARPSYSDARCAASCTNTATHIIASNDYTRGN